MVCTIRESVEADIPTIQSIYAHHVHHGTASFEEEAPSVAKLLRHRKEVLGKGLPYLIAESDGEVVGYCYAAPYRARSAYRYALEHSVYVDHRRKRSGTGRSLLSVLIDQCQQGGWRQMIAVIGDSANTASIGLHRALGFREVGTLINVGFKFGRWIDTVLMQRSLRADYDTSAGADPVASVAVEQRDA